MTTFNPQESMVGKYVLGTIIGQDAYAGEDEPVEYFPILTITYGDGRTANVSGKGAVESLVIVDGQTARHYIAMQEPSQGTRVECSCGTVAIRIFGDPWGDTWFIIPSPKLRAAGSVPTRESWSWFTDYHHPMGDGPELSHRHTYNHIF